MLKVNQLIQGDPLKYKYDKDSLPYLVNFTKEAMKGPFNDEAGNPADFNKDEANIFVYLADNPNKRQAPFTRVDDDFPILACFLGGNVYFYKPTNIELSEELIRTFSENVKKAFDINSTKNLSILSSNSKQKSIGSVVLFSNNVHIDTPYKEENNFIFGSRNVEISDSHNCFIAHARPIDHTFVSNSTDCILIEPVKVSVYKSKNIVVFYPDLTNYSNNTPDLQIYDSNRITILEPYTSGVGVKVNASSDMVIMEAGSVRTDNSTSGIVYRGSDIELDNSSYTTIVYKSVNGHLPIKKKSNYINVSGRESGLNLYELYEKYLKKEFIKSFQEKINSGFEFLEGLNEQLADLGKKLTVKLKMPYPILELNMERAKKSLDRAASDISSIL